jgi:Pentapeptide repeats (9 copies)
MTRDETVALFLQGREAWNAWTEKVLADRKAMQTDGRWAAETAPAGSLSPKNQETRAWMDATHANFSRCIFGPHSSPQSKETATEEREGNGGTEEPLVRSMLIDVGKIDFRGFIFPGDADFVGATFTSRADFGNTAFWRNANFQYAAFAGTAFFGSATFTGQADFQSATFARDANFGGAAFRAAAWFRSTTFLGDALFENASFRGSARFGSAAFGN